MMFRLKGNRLTWGKQVTYSKTYTKSTKDLKPVLSSRAKNKVMYRVYRGVCIKKHKHLFRKVRYDVTVLKKGKAGKEQFKTFGHYHPYKELYEVLHGRAFFLVQNEAVVVINAKKGDKVLIPANHGHLIINQGKSLLVVGNLVSRKCVNSYSKIKRKHGAAYYELNGKFYPNKNYRKKQRLIKSLPNIHIKEGIYEAFVKDPGRFGYLLKKILK